MRRRITDFTRFLFCHFNPRTPGGVRLGFLYVAFKFIRNFNPRTPGGVRLGLLQTVTRRNPDFNPRTPGGVRLWCIACGRQYRQISIHAPRVGCDSAIKAPRCKPEHISIHAPRVGCDYPLFSLYTTSFLFQSTHPGWGATIVDGMATN